MLSKYAEKLLVAEKKRYLEKLSAVNGVDPYSLTSSHLNSDTLPAIAIPDLFNYLVLGTSTYTSDQFKAYRSLEAHNQCYSGWIKELGGCLIDGKYVVIGKVRHSQTFAASPAHCWMISEPSGTVLSAHCTCKAGLGETCTHVAAMLFYIEAYTRIKGPTSCTQSDCKWMLPSHVTNLTYRPLAEMNFSSAKKQKKTFESRLNAASSSTGTSRQGIPTFSAPTPSDSILSNCKPSASSSATLLPTQSEMDNFYLQLSKCGHKPALLSLVSPYSDSYVTNMSINASPLSHLFCKGHMSFTLAELQTMAETVDVNMSQNDIDRIEMTTRGQSKNKNWFLFRAGRVTASILKRVCRTSIESPSVSLLKAICYPSEYIFKSAPTEWGLSHEKAALTKYKESYYSHSDASFEDSGFMINSNYPFMGASPDAMVSCKCCGKGVVEVKCPFNFRGNDIMEYVLSSDSCVSKGDEIQLKKDHQYYYQVQAQMHICEVQFCDFVICTFPSAVPCILVIRVSRDGELWEKCKQQASGFFRSCILPELLGKAYTRSISV